jgi:hypothetical protein
MLASLYAAASDEMASMKRRMLRLLIGALLAVAALIVVLVAALRALFIWATEMWGPMYGNLAVAGGALVVAIIAVVIAAMGRRRRHRVEHAARDARVQAYDTARALGEQVSNTLTGRTGPLHSRKGLTNAVLGAIVIGILLGRRF